MKLAPITLFVYNRPWHTQQTVEALKKNTFANESDLFIYADGTKSNHDLEKVNEVRTYIKSIKGFKSITITLSENNKGLADSIVTGVTEIVNRFGKVIVLEDDIVTSPGFLKYMNEALTVYENDEQVMHIASYLPYTLGQSSLPATFFLSYMSCWGWATWADRWQKAIWDEKLLYKKIDDKKTLYKFNLNGTLDYHNQLLKNINGSLKTWAIKWYSTIFIKNGLCLYPGGSLSTNIGLDGSGENCTSETSNHNIIDYIDVKPIKIHESTKAKSYFIRYFKYGNNSSFFRVLKLKLGIFKHRLFLLFFK